MGQEGYQIMTPAKGWNFMPIMGQAAPEEVLAGRGASIAKPVGFTGAVI